MAENAKTDVIVYLSTPGEFIGCGSELIASFLETLFGIKVEAYSLEDVTLDEEAINPACVIVSIDGTRDGLRQGRHGVELIRKLDAEIPIVWITHGEPGLTPPDGVQVLNTTNRQDLAKRLITEIVSATGLKPNPHSLIR